MKIMKTTTTTHFLHHHHLQPAVLIPPPSKFVLTFRTFKSSHKYISNAYSSSPLTPNSTREENVGSELCACTRRELLCGTSALFFVPLANAVDGENLLLREEISKVISKGKAAGLLRLVFHDAGTFELDDKSGGMNGSIVYELDRPENKGLEKSVKILKKAKSEVDRIQQVSWADIIAVAGAEAISVCGGPKIPLRLGRLDSMSPDPEGRLPEESLDAPRLKQCFKEKGFSTQELVALSGAHTLGNKGFGNPTVFDNSYYKILLQKPWVSSAESADGVGESKLIDNNHIFPLFSHGVNEDGKRVRGVMTTMIGLPSDRALVEDNDCTRWISKYAENQELFFQDFVKAYTKLVNTGVKWRDSL